ISDFICPILDQIFKRNGITAYTEHQSMRVLLACHQCECSLFLLVFIGQKASYLIGIFRPIGLTQHQHSVAQIYKILGMES
uniref:hypothetical protein n=1 Tax=Pseudoalteromonas 'SMAR' TaxID=3416908 RepID=UPI003AF24D78